MLKSLVLLSVLDKLTPAIGATAQFQGLDDLTALPKECESQCKGLESYAPACVNMDTSCLQTICGDAAKFKPCLDCANMGGMYDLLVQSCQSLGLGGGAAPGGESSAAIPGADDTDATASPSPSGASGSASGDEPTASDVSAAEPTAPASKTPTGAAGASSGLSGPSGATASPTAGSGSGAASTKEAAAKPSSSAPSSSAAAASGAAINSGAGSLVASVAGVGAAALVASLF